MTWCTKIYLFNRNTLKRTQYFTMNTGLTFSPLHLQQWVNCHSWERFRLFSRCFSQFPIKFIIHLSNSLATLFSGTVMMEATYIFVIVFRFNKHNISIESLHRPKVFRLYVFLFFSTVVNSHWEPATYTMIFFPHNNNNNHHYSFIHKSTKGWQQGRREVAQDGHHFTHDI